MSHHESDHRPVGASAGEAAAAPAAGDGTASDGRGSSRLRRAAAPAASALDALAAIGAGLAVLAVHNMQLVLNAPYWLDESWVADTVRAPLALVPRLAVSTPLGWTLLLRLVPGDGAQRQRLVPLAFAGLAVATAYLLGRELRLGRYTAGLLAATAALLSPAMLARDDLKQYTAEAFAALVIWLLVARAETRWSRGRLAAIAVVASAGTLVAETAALTGAAALGCLAVAAITRRRWRQLAEVAVAATGALAAFAVIYALVLRPRVNHSFTAYWAPFYSPASVPGAAAFFWARLVALGPYLGFPGAPATAAAAPAGPPGVTPGLIAALALAGAGVVALVLLGRPVLAAMLPATLVIVMAASAAQAYPFGDERTSTFWLVMFPVLMAIAVAAAAHGAGRMAARAPGLAGRLTRPAVAVAACGAAIAGYALATAPMANGSYIADEDTRSQVQFMDAHWRPGDVAIIDYGASFAFAYYYPQAATAYPVVTSNATGYAPAYPGRRDLIIMSGRGSGDVAAALRQARAVLASEAPGGRLWLIRNHVAPAEGDAWSSDLAALTRGGGQLLAYRLAALGYRPAFQPVSLFIPAGTRTAPPPGGQR